jgi:alpha-D-ribose 1-methylphosphonate 5-triphosphate synthase subunit PhnH
MPAHALASTLSPGFADPVFNSQNVFRAVMWALARPGTIEPIIVDLAPPAPLSIEAAAVTLALADYETPLWLDPVLAAVPEVGAFLRFHTGAAIVTDAAAARFALIADPAQLPDFSIFAQGTPDYPDASATLILQVERFATTGLQLQGPGIEGVRYFNAAPLPADLPTRWAENRALFPRGIDLILAGPGGVAALPRSLVIAEA